MRALAFLLAPLAAPLFVEDTARLGAQPCGPGLGTGCYTNYALLADLDGDADLDVLFPNADGYYTQGALQPFVVLANDSAGNFTDVSDTAVGAFQGWLRQVAVGDIDADGDLDVHAPGAWGEADALFVNDGSGVFANEAADRLAGVTSRAGATRFGDLDGDGDLDLVVSDWGANPPGSAGTVRVFTNGGGGVFTEMTSASVPLVASPAGTGPIDLDLFDADGDFDLDLLIDSRIGSALFWRNDGNGIFTDDDAALPSQPGGYAYGPGVCDVDADGDLDVWIDNATANNEEQLLINDGTGTFTDETAARVTGNVPADDNGVWCVDVNGDGHLDAAIASLSANERVLLNDGAGNFTACADCFPTVNDATLGLDFGDLNGDGRLDAVTGQGENGQYLNRLYLGTTAAPVDAIPPRIRAVQRPVAEVDCAQPLVVRFSVSDASVTDAGPRVEARLENVTQGTQSPARFAGGDVFRAEIQVGTLACADEELRVCAVDVRGNEACSAPFTVQLGEGEGSEEAGGGVGCGCRLGGAASARSTLLLVFGFAGMFAARNAIRRRW